MCPSEMFRESIYNKETSTTVDHQTDLGHRIRQEGRGLGEIINQTLVRKLNLRLTSLDKGPKCAVLNILGRVQIGGNFLN